MTVNINRINTKNRLAVLIAAVCICACTVPGTLLTGASTAGLAALSAPGLAQRFDDAGTIISINRRLLAEHDTLFLKVNIDALAGRVLLTGTVPDERAARLLEDLARDTKGVRHVTSRVVISAPRDFGGLTQDSFIRTRLKTKLMSDGNVSAVNFVLRVHRGVIYIGTPRQCGIAR
jgi:osmotically-inducible protein OsmY